MENDDANLSESVRTLTDVMQRGDVIPVISNAFRIEQIFSEDEELSRMMAGLPQFYDEFRSFDQQLTKIWAASINYPMSDDHNLARVSQYLQVEQSSSALRESYLLFMIDRLLKLAEGCEYYRSEEEYKNAVTGYRKFRPRTTAFSDVANQLGYPRFYLDGADDPLRLLARLPVKIYITTSYSNFLEHALEKEGKSPRTQLCFCKRELITDPKHLPDRDFMPSESEPAVVHLFGLEDYPKSLVLSEDDYINFLMVAVQNHNDDNMYPSYLRFALSEPGTSLLLLGYYLRDWEFRTLFRFLSLVRNLSTIEAKSIAIQFRPQLGRKDAEKRSLDYMKKYFEKVKFDITWEPTNKFIYRLYEEYQQSL